MEFQSKASRKKELFIRIVAGLLMLAALVLLCRYVLKNQENAAAAAAGGYAAAERESSTLLSGKIPEGDGSLHAYFLDVGQGDCAVVVAPDGTSMLIDAGNPGDYPLIRSFLLNHSIERLDVVVASHMHADHIGSMAQIVDEFDVVRFYMPNQRTSVPSYKDLMDALDAKGLTPVKLAVSPMDSGPIPVPFAEGVEVTVLSPFTGDYDSENDYSLIVKVKLGETAVLFAGDAEQEAERVAVKALPNRFFRANVLKVGHHGSSSSTCSKFLKAIKPDIAVISVGKNNDYGHPAEKVLNRLKDADIQVLRTDIMGNIHIALDGTNVEVVE